MKNQMMQRLCGMLECLERPCVKKKIDASLEIYPNKNASKPILSAGIDGNWEYSLMVALKVMAVVMLAMWLMCALSRLLHKLF